MTSFPESVMRCIHTMTQSYASTKNYVLITYPVIEIIKYNNTKEVSVKLYFDSKTGTFEIKAPTTKYFSKISHYDYKDMSESRWTRDKGYLFSLINNLKFCGLWERIANKDFITVNRYNKNVDARKLRKILKDVES